jgi:hypothetical protein
MGQSVFKLIKITIILDGGVLSDYSHLIRNAITAYRSEKYFEQTYGGVYTDTLRCRAPPDCYAAR